MDFELTIEAREAAHLAATICRDHCTPERLRAADEEHERFDPRLWRALGEAGLLGLTVPEEYGGAGLGELELIAVLEQLGRHLAPAPLETHAVAAHALALLAPREVAEEWLPRAATGEVVLSCAPTPSELPAGLVPAGTLADLLVLPVLPGTDGALRLLALPTAAPGVTVEPQVITDGDRCGIVSADEAALAAATELGGPEEWDRLADLARVALCARQLGVVDGALALTSAHARTREQFGRPIGTFQAVSQRLADGYIDVLGARLTLQQAAWRLSAGLPCTAEVAEAALWAADAGHRLAHTAVHVHGGVGIDLDGEAHRFFTAAKRGEFLLGGTTSQARTIGRLLADVTAPRR